MDFATKIVIPKGVDPLTVECERGAFYLLTDTYRQNAQVLVYANIELGGSAVLIEIDTGSVITRASSLNKLFGSLRSYKLVRRVQVTITVA